MQFFSQNGTVYNINPNGTLGSPIPPIAIDLANNGIDYLSQSASIVFRDQETGVNTNLAWVGPEDGILVIDDNNSGTIDTLNEFAFALRTPEDDTDLTALRSLYDSNQDGVLDAQDAQFDQFYVWQDANSNAVSEEGELISLNDLDIASIELDYRSNSEIRIEAEGDVSVNGQANINYSDGTTGTAEDSNFEGTLVFDDQPNNGAPAARKPPQITANQRVP